MSEVVNKNIETKKKKIKDPNKFLYSLIAVALAFFIGLLLIIITDNSIRLFITELFYSSFGSLWDFGDFLGTLAWVLPLGLAMVVSFKIGVFNIGTAGQMYLSGIMGFWFASAVGDSLGWSSFIFIGIITIFTGMAISSLIGYLKIKFNINEVISSIMFNWIIYFCVGYIVSSANLNSLIIDKTTTLNPIWLSNIFGGSTKINLGIFFIPILIFGLWFLYKKTRFGIKQDIIGNNPTVADNVGINKNRELMKAMALSGALAGVAGWVYSMGASGGTFDLPPNELRANFYQGITVALIGFNSIFGSLFSAMFVSFFIVSSSINGTTQDLPITDIILALSILFLAITHFFIYYSPIDKLKIIFSNDEKKKEGEK